MATVGGLKTSFFFIKYRVNGRACQTDGADIGSCTGSVEPMHELAKMRETILEQANMLSKSKSMLAKQDKQLADLLDPCKKSANT